MLPSHYLYKYAMLYLTYLIITTKIKCKYSHPILQISNICLGKAKRVVQVRFLVIAA